MRFRCTHRRQRAVVANAHEMMSLPLHCKAVPLVNLPLLFDRMNDETRLRWNEIVADLQIRDNEPLNSISMTAPKAHCASMTAVGKLSPCPKPTTGTLVEYFTVKELKVLDGPGALDHVTIPSQLLDLLETLVRQRPILWPRAFLLVSRYKSQMSLQYFAVYRMLLLDATTLAAEDSTCSFWHLPAFGKFYLKDDEGNYYRVNRLLFGIDGAPELVQIVHEVAAGDPRRVKAQFASPCPVAVHIDNVLAAGSLQSVATWSGLFKKFAAEIGLQLNREEHNTPSPRAAFCGMVLRADTKTVELAAKFMIKASRTPDTPASYMELESKIGKLIYALSVLSHQTFRFWLLFKWWRRTLRALESGTIRWSDRPTIPPPVLRTLEDAWKLVCRNRPAHVTPAANTAVNLDDFGAVDFVLYTDASLDGWGAVLFAAGETPRVYGERWLLAPQDINAAECRAVGLALSLFSSALQGSAGRPSVVLLLVDNTSTRVAVTSQAKSFALAAMAAATTAIAERFFVQLRVAYVPTNANLADAPSRGYSVSPSFVVLPRVIAEGLRGTER